MNTFCITTDSNADLPASYLQAHDISVISLSYTINGSTFDDSHPLPVEEFYALMRKGAMPTTAQVNPLAAQAVFRRLLTQYDNILHIAFSSGLSGSYQNAAIAAQEVLADYPGKKIIVVDSLCASLGQGLLVHKAIELRDKGQSLEDAAAWVEANKLHICHNFTVDDLNHLYRGGRVSKTTAMFGSMLNVKPVLHVDDEGHLIPVGKVRGRKKSLDALVDRMAERIEGYDNPVVFISHGDCLSDAEYVRDQVRARFGIEEFLIHFVGPSIGAHSGPGTVALFFMGSSR